MIEDTDDPIPDINLIRIAVERAGMSILRKLAFIGFSATLKCLRDTVSQCKMRWYEMKPALNNRSHPV